MSDDRQTITDDDAELVDSWRKVVSPGQQLIFEADFIQYKVYRKT